MLLPGSSLTPLRHDLSPSWYHSPISLLQLGTRHRIVCACYAMCARMLLPGGSQHAVLGGSFPPILLRARYAMSMSGTELRILSSSGTDIGYAATRPSTPRLASLRSPWSAPLSAYARAMRCPRVAVRARYAMCGTELRYGPTRHHTPPLRPGPVLPLS
eukprot:2159271-Rhodomonas_salina.1